jgi:ABC-type phosphate transport system substrate-binding protein
LIFQEPFDVFKKLITLTASLTLLMSSAAYAELAIIGHPDSDTGTVDIQSVKKLFLGERKSFPNGLHASPVNHVTGSPDRKVFFSSVMSMSESGYSRHWKRKLSTSAAHLPAEVASYDEVLEIVANTPGSIAYINADQVDDSVKVLFTVNDIESLSLL